VTSNPNGRLAGKVAIVTGAAQGIGRATVERFASEGAHVVCADINRDAAAEVVGTITQAGGSAVFHHTDITDLAQLEACTAMTIERFGRLDILHNNAWWSSGGYLVDLDPGDWDASIRACLTSVFLGMRAALPHMMRSGGGSIINMSSVDGLFGEPCGAPYGVSKAGVILLTKTAALEYGRKNIRVNAIAPGSTDTPALDVMESAAPGFKERSAEANATGRLITAEEIANVVVFLASDESSALTGTTIVADAGWTACCDTTPNFPPYGQPFTLSFPEE
jgi:NAD(P)-dependent dehydrogenase (short-subunit alcohol dehydrogenase family)